MIDLRSFSENDNYQSIQKMFCRIKMKSYFEYLTELTGESRFIHMYHELLDYTDIDDKYMFDFEMQDYILNGDITLGEMLVAGGKMLNSNKYYPKELRTQAEYTGQKIISYIMIHPFISIHRLKESKK